VTLTAKQERFVDEYLIDLNATQAAIRSGYSEKTARQLASRLLSDVDIQDEITKRRAALSEKKGLTVERIVDEMIKLGFSNMQDYMKVGGDGLPQLDWSGLTRDQAAALSEVTVDTVAGHDEDENGFKRDTTRVKFKLNDKRAALVDLGKHLGMFGDKLEHSLSQTLEQLVLGSMKPKP
jgi:phage terminase small subunit